MISLRCWTAFSQKTEKARGGAVMMSTRIPLMVKHHGNVIRRARKRHRMGTFDGSRPSEEHRDDPSRLQIGQQTQPRCHSPTTNKAF
jgi:hypothetical protein